MGRYDGEVEDFRAPCAPTMHNFAANGTCWMCGHHRIDMIANAEAVLRILDPTKLAKTEAA